MRSKSAWPACDVCASRLGCPPDLNADGTPVQMNVSTLCNRHFIEYMLSNKASIMAELEREKEWQR